jgi:hypothetical protein
MEIKSKTCYLAISFAIFFSLPISGQELKGQIYSFTFIKNYYENGIREFRKIQIDSSGRVFKDGSNTKMKIKIKRFSSDINKFIFLEKINKEDGSNKIIFSEPPKPKETEQYVMLSVIFLDDYYKEQELANKTSYTWGGLLDVRLRQYTVYRYLKKSEIRLINRLLK